LRAVIHKARARELVTLLLHIPIVLALTHQLVATVALIVATMHAANVMHRSETAAERLDTPGRLAF
jgi:heme A synthase